MTRRWPQSSCLIARSLLNSSSRAAPCRHDVVAADPRSGTRVQHISHMNRQHSSISKHRDLVNEVPNSEEDSKVVTVAGLVRSIRKQKRVAFASIADGSTLAPLQAILEPEQAEKITNGAYVELCGTWKPSQGKGQACELVVEQINDIGETNPDVYPIQKKTQTPEYLRTLPHLRLRVTFNSLIARARSQLTTSITEFYSKARKNGPVYQVHPPLITSSDCEGAGEVFTISPKRTLGSKNPKENLYFREPKYLTVSGQLHLEAYSAELGDVWTLSPTFRAEESETPRHLSEFYMLEAEFRSINSLKEVMVEAEELIRYLVRDFSQSPVGQEVKSYYMDAKHRDDAATIDVGERWSQVLAESWLEMTYSEAIKYLQQKASNSQPFEHQPSYFGGLQLEHERFLVEHAAENRPLFVTDYPSELKPFYMLRNDNNSGGNDSDTVACFDLLFPNGTAEVVGGSLREHRLPQLVTAMREKGLVRSRDPHRRGVNTNTTTTHPSEIPGDLFSHESVGSLQWYLDLRRYGSAPHGGFGVGFDRLLAWLCNVASIRDTVGFPRWVGRADC